MPSDSPTHTSGPVVDLEHAAALIAASALTLRHAVLCGSPTPNQRDIYERMHAPQDGDWVCETSTLGGWGARKDMSPLDAVGRLVRTAREKMPIEEWDEQTDGPWPTEKVWYVRTLDGREFRWVNADFVAIPGNPLFPKPPGSRMRSYP